MKFKFKAFTRQGELKEGVITASSKEEALKLLQEQELLVTYLAEARIKLFEFLLRKPNLKDIYLFSRQLAYLIKAQTPLDEAIKSLAETSPNAYFRDVLFQIYQDLISGVPFSSSLSRFPDIFDDYFVGMVKIGESVGTLDETMNYIAKHLENQIKFRNKAIQALIYPAIVLAMFLVTMIVLAISVIPRIAGLFKEANVPLPLITQIFIYFSNFLINYGIYSAIILAGVIYYFYKYFQTREGTGYFFSFINILPVIGPLFKNIYIAQFLESLYYLTRGGVPLVEALDIIKNSLKHPVYEEALGLMIEEVKKGKPFSGAMEEFPHVFSRIVIEAMKTAERTGQMTEIVLTILGFYTEMVESQFANLGEALQPFLILILGGGLVLLEASLLIPLLNLTKIIQNL
ncbi:MAG: hypothetical protein C4347_01590 [Patescibacteria group bacterium]